MSRLFLMKLRPVFHGLAALGIMFALASCGSLAYRGSISGSAGGLQNAVALDVADDVDDEETKHVRVFDASNLPPGLTAAVGKDGKQAVRVDESRYEYAGVLEAHPQHTVFTPYGFYPYNETWRKFACWWQVPLQWAFIMIYWNLVPTSWVCWVSTGGNSPSGIRERQEHQIEILKRMAVVVGADTLVYEGGSTTGSGLTIGAGFGITGMSGRAFAYDDKTLPNPTDAKYAKYRMRSRIPRVAAGGTSDGASFTDTVVLRNGVELSGVSTAVTRDSVVVTYSSGKTVVLRKSEVRSVKKGQ